MKFYDNNILCLEYDEYIACFDRKEYNPEELYKSDKKRGKIIVIGVGGNGRGILIEYETMSKDRQDKVKAKYGNPYEYIRQQPIIEHIKYNYDDAAERFYSEYTLTNTGMKLPDATIPKLTAAATWLNAIKHFTEDKRALKQALNISIADFWIMAGKMVHVHNIDLPTSDRKLKDKLTKYKIEGYKCLIEEWRYGNSYSKKVKDEVSEALLIQLLANPNHLDDTFVAARYNEWAVKNGRQAITPGAVSYRRKQNEHLITLTRDGKGANYTKYSPQIPQMRASAPLGLVNSDDNLIDLYFKQERVRKVKRNGEEKLVNETFYQYRPAGYFIRDVYNDYILGYAIGDVVTIDLIKQAYLNAIHHIMELTGGCYLPHQIKTDRWGIDTKLTSTLSEFFKSLAVFTPATAKVGQAKHIESSFNVLWHQVLKKRVNYAGHNVGAKEKLNPDAIDLYKKDYPIVDEIPQKIAEFVEEMRQLPGKNTGKTVQQEWLEAFHASEISKKRQISAEKRIQLLGVTHPHTNKLTAGGIRLTVNKILTHYEIPHDLYLENVGKKVQIMYDPYDMNRVLVTDGHGLRFVADKLQHMPSAIIDHTPESRKRLNDHLDRKKEVMQTITDAIEERMNVLTREQIDMQSVLQGGVTIKSLDHKAQRAHHGQIEQPKDDEFDWRKAL